MWDYYAIASQGQPARVISKKQLAHDRYTSLSAAAKTQLANDTACKNSAHSQMEIMGFRHHLQATQELDLDIAAHY